MIIHHLKACLNWIRIRNKNWKIFIYSLSKLVRMKKPLFIQTSFDRLWMKIFPFLFLILKGFYKGFQMRYHLFFNSNGKAVKTIKMFFWKSAMWYIMSMSVYQLPTGRNFEYLEENGVFKFFKSLHLQVFRASWLDRLFHFLVTKWIYYTYFMV